MIHIALTIDTKFTRYCAVTIVSILQNNSPKDIALHIVAQRLPHEDCLFLQQIAERSGASIYFYDIPAEKTKDYKVRWKKKRLSAVVFYRCLLASILPASISRVLYLDCDTLVLGNLKELWDINMDGMAVAGVQDLVTPNPGYFKRLQYDPSFNYINGGVLLLNLDYWRKHNIESECLKYYLQYPDRVVLNDQDILNGLLYDRKKVIDMKWNVQDDFYRAKSYAVLAGDPSYKNAVLHPVILHYSGRKAWAYHAMHPLRSLFFYYQSMVISEQPTRLQAIGTQIHRFIHLLPYYMGWKQWKYIQTGDMRTRLSVGKPIFKVFPAPSLIPVFKRAIR